MAIGTDIKLDEYIFDIEVQAIEGNSMRSGWFHSTVHKIGDLEAKFKVYPRSLLKEKEQEDDTSDVPDDVPDAITLILHCPTLHGALGCRVPDQKCKFEVIVTALHTSDLTRSITTTKSCSFHPNGAYLSPFLEAHYEHSLQFNAFQLSSNIEELLMSGFLTEQSTVRFRVTITGNFNVLQHFGLQTSSPDITATMWHNREFTDFYIAAKGQEIRCHRAVLSAASPVFHGMVFNDMQEGLQSFASIDESPEYISLMIGFVYTGSLPVVTDCTTLVNILRIADCYQLPQLVELCASRIPAMLPTVCKNNLCDVVMCLSLLQGINPKGEQLFNSVLDQVRNDAKLFKNLLSALTHRTTLCPVALGILPEEQPPFIAHKVMIEVGVQCGCEDSSADEIAHVCADATGEVSMKSETLSWSNGTTTKEQLPTDKPSHNTVTACDQTDHDASKICHRQSQELSQSDQPLDVGQDVLCAGSGGACEVEAKFIPSQTESCPSGTSHLVVGNEAFAASSGDRPGPRRKTRRGRSKNRNSNDHAHGAKSWCTYDSWQ